MEFVVWDAGYFALLCPWFWIWDLGLIGLLGGVVAVWLSSPVFRLVAGAVVA